MTTRKITKIIPALETSDGAGVRVRRSIGSMLGLRLDPFLMLDEFGTDDPNDYIEGFPSHPHRGFTTVTYMIDGRMEHRDHLGNVGNLGPGGLQWMDAARGVIHSEMPKQTEGRMRGFQLWINLPAAQKMRPASYRDFTPQDIPEVGLAAGGSVKVLAGTAQLDGKAVPGPVNGARHDVATDPLYLDIALPANVSFTHPVPPGYSAFVYVYEGSVTVGDNATQVLPVHQAGILDDAGDEVMLRSGAQATRLILVAGRPLGEPVEQYGPFVMNTREELAQAVHDYQAGTLTEPAPEHVRDARRRAPDA
ncbi:MAG TPA: pirin family protein [Nevskiaceae bacterium]